MELEIKTITDNNEWETGATEHSMKLQKEIQELKKEIQDFKGRNGKKKQINQMIQKITEIEQNMQYLLEIIACYTDTVIENKKKIQEITEQIKNII